MFISSNIMSLHVNRLEKEVVVQIVEMKDEYINKSPSSVSEKVLYHLPESNFYIVSKNFPQLVEEDPAGRAIFFTRGLQNSTYGGYSAWRNLNSISLEFPSNEERDYYYDLLVKSIIGWFNQEKAINVSIEP